MRRIERLLHDLVFKGPELNIGMNSFMRVIKRVNTANPACEKLVEKRGRREPPALANC